MADSMSSHDERQHVVTLFNLVASGYDNAALRYFPFAADRLITQMQPAPGTKILDVATGTGVVALAAAQAIGEGGRVAAIDLAESMLERLQEKIDKFGIRNIDLHVMDASSLDFRRDYFDHVICSFGLFFLPDMLAALKGWARVLKPGGRILFTSFGKESFQPMADMFMKQLAAYSALASDQHPPIAAQRLAEVEQCRRLLVEADLGNIKVQTEQLGYHLKDETVWWDIVWNSGFRGLAEKIPEEQRDAFKTEHLAEVRRLVTDKGLWLNVEVIFSAGTKT
mgnify:CR=1 FL=1